MCVTRNGYKNVYKRVLKIKRVVFIRRIQSSGAYFLIFIFLFSALSFASETNPSLESGFGHDTLCNIWVTFTDKPGTTSLHPTNSALKRRVAAGFGKTGNIQDADVSTNYVWSIKALGARCRTVYTWGNAASFSVDPELIPRIAAMPFVASVSMVRSFRKVPPESKPPVLFKRKDQAFPEYGENAAHLWLLNIPLCHDYLALRGDSLPGSGTKLAFFDAGFMLTHPCFNRIKQRGAIVADSDFVRNVRSVAVTDPEGTSHGALTLSLVGGYDPDNLIGAACNAEFILARTENDTSETHVEEDYWAAALVWAENLGADIVSSSLGYPDLYPPSSIDGNTAIISNAARIAVERGMIIINSAGNEGPVSATINPPADVVDVIAVGGVLANGEIASFSSRGPTADGRIKPDCVAMGYAVTLPQLSSGYTQASGTSFAAPVVSGVCALIKQRYPTITGADLRTRLYRSCRFSHYQAGVDNAYGRGIPDALYALMDSSEVFVSLRNILDAPLSGATIKGRRGDTLTTTNLHGNGVFSLAASSLPETISVSLSRFPTKTIVIDSLPKLVRSTITGYMHFFRIVDQSGQRVPEATLWGRCAGEQQFFRAQNFNQLFWTPCSDSGLVQVFATASGFFGSDTISVDTKTLPDTTTITLRPVPSGAFMIYPNIINISTIRSGRAKLFSLINPPDNLLNSRWTISVCSLDGRVLFSISNADQSGTFSPIWNFRTRNGTPLSPGAYYCICATPGTNYVKKLIILGR